MTRVEDCSLGTRVEYCYEETRHAAQIDRGRRKGHYYLSVLCMIIKEFDQTPVKSPQLHVKSNLTLRRAK